MRNVVLIAAAVVAALAVPSAAPAHVGMSPAFLAVDATTTVTFDTPNEREAEPMTGLAVTLPAGLVVSDTDQPETQGWTLTASGNEASWTGGSLGTGETQPFELKVSARGEPGAVTITAQQRYESGATVDWPVSFTILPPAGDSPNQQLGWALVAAIVGVLVIGGSLVVARRLRRRPSGTTSKAPDDGGHPGGASRDA